MMRGTLVPIKALDSQGHLTSTRFEYALSSAIIDIGKNERWGKSVVNIGVCKSIVYRMTFVHANLFYSCGSQR
jgi:hypothetical protein